MKKGEQRTITVSFTADYGAPHLAGKEALFTVISRDSGQEGAGIDEEFVKNFDKYESIAALREDVRQGLVAEADRKAAAAFDRHIDDKLLAAERLRSPSLLCGAADLLHDVRCPARLVANGMESKKAAEFSAKLHDQFKDEARGSSR
jgi:trigger factor